MLENSGASFSFFSWKSFLVARIERARVVRDTPQLYYNPLPVSVSLSHIYVRSCTTISSRQKGQTISEIPIQEGHFEKKRGFEKEEKENLSALTPIHRISLQV